MRDAVLAAVVAACVVAVAAMAPASAQSVPGCPPEEPIDARLTKASVVFVGTVAALGDRSRVAYVDVIRVWKGGALPKRVSVRGTIATQSKVNTALDRLYAKGRTYLFAPTTGTPPRFVENQCSPTQALTTELSAKAPPGGGDPPTQDAGVSIPGASLTRLLPLAIGIVAAGGLVALLVLARRAQRRV